MATELASRAQGYTQEELQLATRNRGMPLEALRHPITPTGLHYLLVHFDIPDVDAGAWRLLVGGEVSRPLELSLDDLRRRPARTVAATLECAGNGRTLMEPRALSQPWLVEAVGTAEWTGVPLAELLADAGVRDTAVELVFTGADRGVQGGVEQDYQRSLPLAEAQRGEVLLAYEMNGRALEPQHGFPLRLLVPGWYGMASVKWLRHIDAVPEPFAGYQMTSSYRLTVEEHDLGEPVSHIRVRALMVPPGIPDFFTRHRLVDSGPVPLQGRAWCGTSPVVRVEVGVDGVWTDAELDPAPAAHAPGGIHREFMWRGWRWTWEATPGEHVLACRATDARGGTQPLEAPWNRQGMANNTVQQVPVTVR